MQTFKCHLFADHISNASVSLNEHSMYSDMDTQNLIMCMCLKIPVHIGYKWRNHTTNSLEKWNVSANLQDRILFVEQQTTVLTDPVYGGGACLVAHVRVLNCLRRSRRRRPLAVHQQSDDLCVVYALTNLSEHIV